MGALPGIRLVVFAKLPLPGQVKTRLAESIGPDKARALYRAWVPPLIGKLVRLGPGVSVEITLAPPDVEGIDPDRALAMARGWIPYPVDWSLQTGEGLGERLKTAFDLQLEGGWERVFALGTDSPHLSPDVLEANFDLIEANDLVLGPAEDGGCYTIGMKRPPGDLFKEVRWSTEFAFEDMEKGARTLGWSVGAGPLSYDIDTLEDLNRLIRDRAVENWPLLRSMLNGE